MSGASEADTIAMNPGDQARARSQLYGLLARVFRTEADAALLRHLRHPEVLPALGGAGARFAASLRNQSTDALVAELAEEHARLFLGPGAHVSLHESVLVRAEGGLLWGEETADVAAFMREAGFELPARSGMIPDHLSVELEFMARLCNEECQAFANADEGLLHSAKSWQMAFLSNHLGRWVHAVQDRTMAMGPTLFHEAFVSLLVSFVREDHRQLQESSLA